MIFSGIQLSETDPYGIRFGIFFLNLQFNENIWENFNKTSTVPSFNDMEVS